MPCLSEKNKLIKLEIYRKFAGASHFHSIYQKSKLNTWLFLYLNSGLNIRNCGLSPPPKSLGLSISGAWWEKHASKSEAGAERSETKRRSHTRWVQQSASSLHYIFNVSCIHRTRREWVFLVHIDIHANIFFFFLLAAQRCSG